jgi:hypothetical protein
MAYLRHSIRTSLALQEASQDPDASPSAVVDTEHGSSESMLVWARSGPAMEVQARWTAALARGLKRDATLMDVVETPESLAPSQEEVLQDRVANRLGELRQLHQEQFHDVRADVQVRLTRSAERNVVDSAKLERRDPIVLWAPVREWVIRTLLRTTDCTVLVLRAPESPSDLTSVGVADGDRPALSIAQALIRGARTDLSLRQVHHLDPERVDEVPCQVACVSFPTPSWARSRLFRRQRPVPETKGGIVEVYCGEDQTT